MSISFLIVILNIQIEANREKAKIESEKCMAVAFFAVASSATALFFHFFFSSFDSLLLFIFCIIMPAGHICNIDIYRIWLPIGMFAQDSLLRYPAPSSPLAELKTQLPPQLPSDPRVWNRDDVAVFLQFCEREFDLPKFEMDLFQMNGKALCCLLTKKDLSERIPGAGDVLHNFLQMLIKESQMTPLCKESASLSLSQQTSNVVNSWSMHQENFGSSSGLSSGSSSAPTTPRNFAPVKREFFPDTPEPTTSKSKQLNLTAFFC